MPKKGKQVQSPEGDSKTQKVVPLPQVWLPNQVNGRGCGTTCMHTHTTHATHTQPEPDESMTASPPPHSYPSPSQDEQDRMASFWALEEAKGPQSWDDDQELDYSKIAKKRGNEDESNESYESGISIVPPTIN